MDATPIRRALVSVYDKTDIAAFARGLIEAGAEILSSGGTARALREAGVAVRDVQEWTGFPEMLGHRVVTLHPKVHGGILALRDDPAHQADMEKYGIEPIDLVCVSMYPFAQAIAQPQCTREQAIEMIDIGGPAMVRAAAATYSAKGLRINAIAPTLTDTPLAKPIIGSEQARELSKRMHPLGQIGDPGDVASLATWLLSDHAKFVTGQTFVVDGGISTIVPKPKA